MSHINFQKNSQNIVKEQSRINQKQLEQINEEDSKCNSSYLQPSCMDGSMNSVHINLGRPQDDYKASLMAQFNSDRSNRQQVEQFIKIRSSQYSNNESQNIERAISSFQGNQKTEKKIYLFEGKSKRQIKEMKEEFYTKFHQFEYTFVDEKVFIQNKKKQSFFQTLLDNFFWGTLLIYPHQRKRIYSEINYNINLFLKKYFQQIVIFIFSIIFTAYWIKNSFTINIENLESLNKQLMGQKLEISKFSGIFIQYLSMILITCQLLNWIIKILKKQKLSIIFERFMLMLAILLVIEMEAFFFSKIQTDQKVNIQQNFEIFHNFQNYDRQMETILEYQQKQNKKIKMTILMLLIVYQGFILSKILTFFNSLDQSTSDQEIIIHPPIFMDLYLIIYSLDRLNIFKLITFKQMDIEWSIENFVLIIAFVASYLYNRQLQIDIGSRKNFIYKGFKINKNSSAYPIIKRQVELSNMQQIWLKSLQMLPETLGIIIFSLPLNFYNIEQEIQIEWTNNQFWKILDLQKGFFSNVNVNQLLQNLVVKKKVQTNQNDQNQDPVKKNKQQISMWNAILQILKNQIVEKQLNIYQAVEKENCDFKIQSSGKYINIIESNLIDHIENSLINQNDILTELFSQKQYYLYMVNDVSQQKIIQKFQKLQEKNFMTVATVAHDLRAPLNFLKSNNELIKINLQKSDREKLEQYFKRFDNQFYYQTSMIEDVLDLAKIKHKKFHLQIELFDIHKSINEVIEMLSEQSVLKGIDLAAIIHENVPQMVSTDPNRLKRVFINLIDNALKFTSRGHIHLKVNSSKPYQKAIPENQSKEENNNDQPYFCDLNFEIEDSGPGIQSEKLRLLFKAFGKIENNEGLNKNGIGLGLMISKDIVEKMQGNIKIESTLGQGTTFKFSIQAGVLQHNQHQNQPIIKRTNSFDKIQTVENKIEQQIDSSKIFRCQTNINIKESVSSKEDQIILKKEASVVTNSEASQNIVLQPKIINVAEIINKKQIVEFQKQENEIRKNIMEDSMISLNDSQQKINVSSYLSKKNQLKPKFINQVNESVQIHKKDIIVEKKKKKIKKIFDNINLFHQQNLSVRSIELSRDQLNSTSRSEEIKADIKGFTPTLTDSIRFQQQSIDISRDNLNSNLKSQDQKNKMRTDSQVTMRQIQNRESKKSVFKNNYIFIENIQYDQLLQTPKQNNQASQRKREESQQEQYSTQTENVMNKYNIQFANKNQTPSKLMDSLNQENSSCTVKENNLQNQYSKVSFSKYSKTDQEIIKSPRFSGKNTKEQ